MQILDRAKLWKEGMMDQIKREITIMKDLRTLLAFTLAPSQMPSILGHLPQGHMSSAAPWRPVQNGLRAADHPHIVDLKEVMASKDKIYMVMEFMPGGELFDKIVADGPLEEDVARRVFQQLLDALDYCHKRSIFHRSGRWPQYVVPSYLAAGTAEAAYILQV